MASITVYMGLSELLKAVVQCCSSGDILQCSLLGSGLVVNTAEQCPPVLDADRMSYRCVTDPQAGTGLREVALTLIVHGLWIRSWEVRALSLNTSTPASWIYRR